MMGFIGGIALVIGVVGLFTEGAFGVGIICILVGAFFVWGAAETEKDNQLRHQNDYGKVARCYKCGSTNVYAMTYDDKRDSINFWGAASTKIGKRYHCDNCGNEW